MRATHRRLHQQATASAGRVRLPSHVPAVFVGGLNYKSHAEEVKLPLPKFPIWAMKPPSSLLYPAPPTSATPDGVDPIRIGSEILVPKAFQHNPDIDYEGELAVVIGETCRGVPNNAAAVQKVVAGFTVGLDITSRRWQGKKGGMQWCYAKALDTWCPLGPDLVDIPLDALPELRLETTLNGETMQSDRIGNMVFSVADLVSFLSESMTLQRGTVILTGTPAGVGFTRNPPRYLADGDRLAVTIDRIGTLSTTVHFES